MSTNKKEQLIMINKQLQFLIEDEENWLANLANAAALLFHELPDINWAGFYLFQNKELILGPFQGLPACIRIKLGEGVCGSAAHNLETYVVEDVGEFPGHISCDENSNSEMVIPIFGEGKRDLNNLIGVLDLDSPLFNRFDGVDKRYLEDFINILVEETNMEKLKENMN